MRIDKTEDDRRRTTKEENNDELTKIWKALVRQ